MENLFDYAPKELTQDGFIRWVCANYREPEIKELVKDFILFLTDGKVDIDDPEFRFLNTWSQVNHMDLGCDFFYAESDRYSRHYLVIEDKTTSWEHNQLKTYNKVLQRWDAPHKRERAIKVFYKTSPTDEEEIARVKDAGWRMFQLPEIVNFWGKYKSHPNLIVSSYAKHILKIGESSETVTMPSTNDLIAWYSYMKKILLPRIANDVESAQFHVETGRYGYVYITAYPKGRSNDFTPYLEIRSRDLLGGRFVGRILKYGKNIDAKSFKLLRQTISENGGEIFKANWGHKRMQQAGTTAIRGTKLSSTSEEALISSIEAATRAYLKIVAIWDESVRK